MAKKCSTCNRTYPDHLPACPHCERDRARADDVLSEDIEIVPDESGARRPPAKRPPTHPAIPPEEVLDVVPDEPLEVGEAEVVGDVEEVLEATPAPPAPG